MSGTDLWAISLIVVMTLAPIASFLFITRKKYDVANYLMLCAILASTNFIILVIGRH